MEKYAVCLGSAFFDMGTQTQITGMWKTHQDFLPLKVPPNCFGYSILYEDKRNFFLKAFDHF
jgi:hypothetical protein